MQPGSELFRRPSGRASGSALLILVAGCAANAPVMEPELALDTLMALPGGTAPVEAHCREQADFAVRQLPIQRRQELAAETSGATRAACVEVLTVFVSVTMLPGDSTDDAFAAVREQMLGQDAQTLVDSCDIHYRSWRLLQGENPQTSRSNSPLEGARYEGWVDRCFAVLRLLATRPPPSPG